MSQHLKPLFIKVHMDGIPINRVLVDNGAAVNILPWGMLKKINKIEADLIRSDVLVSGFAGIIPVELKVGNKITNVVFFVVHIPSQWKDNFMFVSAFASHELSNYSFCNLT